MTNNDTAIRKNTIRISVFNTKDETVENLSIDDHIDCFLDKNVRYNEKVFCLDSFLYYAYGIEFEPNEGLKYRIILNKGGLMVLNCIEDEAIYRIGNLEDEIKRLDKHQDLIKERTEHLKLDKDIMVLIGEEVRHRLTVIAGENIFGMKIGK